MKKWFFGSYHDFRKLVCIMTIVRDQVFSVCSVLSLFYVGSLKFACDASVLRAAVSDFFSISIRNHLPAWSNFFFYLLFLFLPCIPVCTWHCESGVGELTLTPLWVDILFPHKPCHMVAVCSVSPSLSLQF